MNIPKPMLEPRLQARYQKLVHEHLHTSEGPAAGSRALPGVHESFASTQAAWRFYQNADVTLPALMAPLHAQACHEVPVQCRRYGLVLPDWSELNYGQHSSKTDRRPVSKDLGYELAAALLISDQTGQPIAPVSLSLRAADGWHTSGPQQVAATLAPLALTTLTIHELRQRNRGLPLVHIIDRGGDSLLPYRQWQAAGELFLVRANDAPRVVWQEQTQALQQVAAQVPLLSAQAVEVAAKVCGQLFVGATQVVLARPALPRTKTGKRRWIKGLPLSLRLLVCQLRLPDETLVAQGYWLSNVPCTVTAHELAQWYDWRWRMESYFKLLKSHGFQVEAWQQESAEKIAQRLLIAAMACLLVWQRQRAQDPETVALRDLLIRLSGRQGRRAQATAPALLSGLWVFLAAIELLEHYDLNDLKFMARLAVPGYA